MDIVIVKMGIMTRYNVYFVPKIVLHVKQRINLIYALNALISTKSFHIANVLKVIIPIHPNNAIVIFMINILLECHVKCSSCFGSSEICIDCG